MKLALKSAQSELDALRSSVRQSTENINEQASNFKMWSKEVLLCVLKSHIDHGYKSRINLGTNLYRYKHTSHH